MLTNPLFHWKAARIVPLIGLHYQQKGATCSRKAGNANILSRQPDTGAFPLLPSENESVMQVLFLNITHSVNGEKESLINPRARKRYWKVKSRAKKISSVNTSHLPNEGVGRCLQLKRLLKNFERLSKP